jgi:hypothetical protein
MFGMVSYNDIQNNVNKYIEISNTVHISEHKQ